MTANPRNVASLTEFSAIERRELALRALVCEEAFERFVAGRPVRALTRERITRALRDAGLEHLVPPNATRAPTGTSISALPQGEGAPR